MIKERISTAALGYELPEFARFDLNTGEIEGGTLSRRYLSDLRGSFASDREYQSALAGGNPLLYTVRVFCSLSPNYVVSRRIMRCAPPQLKPISVAEAAASSTLFRWVRFFLSRIQAIGR